MSAAIFKGMPASCNAPPNTDLLIPGIVLNGNLPVPTASFIAAGPTKGNKPPITAPSPAKRTLFLKLATANSSPFKSLVSIGVPGSSVGSSNILYRLL